MKRKLSGPVRLLAAAAAAMLIMTGCAGTADTAQTAAVQEETVTEAQETEETEETAAEETEEEEQTQESASEETEEEQQQEPLYAYSDLEFVPYDELDPELLSNGVFEYDGTMEEFLDSGDYLTSEYVTVYRDGDAILVFVQMDAAMSHSYSVLCRSLDGGESWDYLSSLFVGAGTVDDAVFADEYFVMTSGSAVYDGSNLSVYADSCGRVMTVGTEDLMPEDLDDDEGVYAVIEDLDAEAGTVTLAWHPADEKYGEADTDIVLARTEVALDGTGITQLGAD